MEKIIFNAPQKSKYDIIFSNFVFSPILIDGDVYSTVEHAFQAGKTNDFDEKKIIRKALSPSQAKKLGRKCTLREDWEDIKYKAMVVCLKEKFKIPYYRMNLLSTGDAEIIEDASEWNDAEWGIGALGDGKNLLGKAIMEIRGEIRKEIVGIESQEESKDELQENSKKY